MAQKADLKLYDGQIVNGYVYDDNLGLFLDPSDNLWKCVHRATGFFVCGPSGRFKRKRACLTFIEHIAGLDWSATTEEENYIKNGGFEALVPLYKEAVRLALEVE